VARTDGGHHLQRDGGYHHFLVDRVCRFALPWVSWAAGDLAVKLAIGVCLLAPFRALLWKMAPLRATS
jgi:uncharacterized PurR-regulated membrane protein YhhQ (DUF165 family)